MQPKTKQKPQRSQRPALSPTATPPSGSGTPSTAGVSPFASPNSPSAPSTSRNAPAAVISSSETALSSATAPDTAKKRQQRALKAASTFRTLLTIAEKALDGCQVWGPKAAVETAGEILRITQLKKENDDTIKSVQREAQHVLDMSSEQDINVSSGAPVVVSPELQKRIDRFQAEIVEHLHELDSYQVAKPPSQATKLSDKVKAWLAIGGEVLAADAIAKALPEVNRKISASIQNFILVGQINNEAIAQTTLNQVVEIAEHVRAMHKAQTNSAQPNVSSGGQSVPLTSQERDLLAQLYPVKTALHSAEGAPRTCHAGTRTAVLEQVGTWFRDPTSPSVLWLTGIAGTGKTTIAQSICELLEPDLGASFLFSRDFAERRRPSNILPTIAYQLAYARPALRPAIFDMLSKDIDFASKSVRVQAQELLSRALGSEMTSDFPVTLLLFDALDECDKDNNQEGGDFVPLLLRFLRLYPSRFKVVITSRPEPSIRAMLESGSGQTDLFVLHEVDRNIVQSDIEAYLRHELGEIVRKRGLGDTWPVDMREEQVKQLTLLADRLFIFAATVVKASTKTPLPAKMIQSFLENVTRSNLSIHGPLDTMYYHIIKGVIPADADKEEVQDLVNAFQSVVGAIVTLEQPLTFMSLKQLLNVDEDQLRAIIGPLYSVLYMDDALERPIQVFHLSFPDFLTDDARCSDSRFRIVRRNSHSMLSLGCLRIMNKQLKRDICGIGDASLLNIEVENLEERREQCTSAELRYACLYWWAHLEDTKSATEELVKELETFTSGGLLYWLELLSLTGDLRSALIGLPKAIGWCRSVILSGSQRSYRTRVLYFVSNKFPEVVALYKKNKKMQEAWLYQLLANAATLLYDVNRMTQAFFRPISEAALQVYETPMIFMPRCPLLSQLDRLYSVEVKMMTKQRAQWSQDLQVMEGHKSKIRHVTVSPNGLLLASCSDDETIRLWDFASGISLICLDSVSHHLRFSTDSSQLFSLAKNLKVLQTWDVVSGDVLSTFDLFLDDDASNVFRSSRCEEISPSGGHVAFGLENGDLYMLTVDRTTTCLQGHRGPVTSVTFSPDGLHVVSGSGDETVRVWDTQSSDCIASIHGRTGYPISKACVSPDGLSIIALGRNPRKGTSRVWTWSVRTQQLLSAMKIAANLSASSLCLNETSLAYLLDNSETLYTRDVTLGKSLSVFRGHTKQITATAFTPDRLYVVSGSEDSTIRIWDTQINTGANSSSERRSENHNMQAIHATVFSADRTRLISESRDKTICCWDLLLGKLTSKIRKEARIVGFSAKNTPVGLNWETYYENPTINVWNAETGEDITTLEGHSDSVRDAAFSPDFTRLASGSKDNTVRIWNTAMWECTATLTGHTHWVNCVCFSPDGSRVVSGSSDRTVRIWNTATWECTATLTGHTDWVNCVCFSPDGSRVVSGSDDKTVRVWDAVTGDALAVLEGHTYTVFCICFSPDGGRVVSGSVDRTVRVWDAGTGDALAVLRGHTRYVDSVRFSSDGLSIVSEQWGGNEREWKAGIDFPLPTSSSPLPPVFNLDDSGWLFITLPPTTPRRRLCWLPVERRGPVASSGSTVALLSVAGIATALSVTPDAL